MGMNLDAIGDTFDWKVEGNIFGHPFEWIGILAVTDNARKEQLLALISQYEQLLKTSPNDARLQKMGVCATAKELLKGWRDPDGQIVWQNQQLESTPENVEFVLNKFPGVDVAVCLAWFDAANGERARLGNSASSHGFGAMARQVANGRGRP